MKTEFTGRCVWCRQRFQFAEHMLNGWTTCPHCGKETECSSRFTPSALKLITWSSLALAAVVLSMLLVKAVLVAPHPELDELTEHPQRRLMLQTRGDLVRKYGRPVAHGASTQFSPGERVTFASEKLSVEAEFAGDACHYLKYRLPHKWTDAQIAMALAKNGAAWSKVPALENVFFAPIASVTFTSKEGHHARYSPAFHWLEIWSCKLIAQSRQQQAQKQRMEAEMPKF